jgi:Ca2+-binding EF-hand superfamily protein
VLNLSELPPHVAEALKGLDKDGDGHINLSELHIGAQEASHSVSKVRAREYRGGGARALR